MKIAFLSHLDLNLYLFRLPIMQELVKNNYEVYAIVPRGEVFYKFSEFGIKAVAYNIDRASLNPLKEVQTLFEIQKVLKEIQPDILHTFMHKPNIYANLLGYKKRINTVTGLGSFFIHNDTKSKLIRFVIEMLYKISTKTTNKVVFQNSDDLALFLQRNIVKQNQAVLIRSSGVDVKKFAPQPKDIALLKKYNLENKVVVLMVARVLKDKGVQEYIAMANKLKDEAVFLYIGEQDSGNKNSFNPSWENIIYLGFQSDVKKFIALCDIFVLPSYREGVPRTLLEAAAMQKPLITTNAPGCREVVEDGYNGFLVPIKDTTLLTQKTSLLIQNKTLRETLGKNARVKIEQEFSIEEVVKQYMKVYNDL